MGRWWRQTACERAMQWSSLALDGELSQLEQTALSRHLSGCARCRESSAEIEAFTGLLRDEPLVLLGHEVVAHVAPRARRRIVRGAVASLAFAAVVAASVLGVVGFPGSGSGAQSALSFQSQADQQRFASVEARRLEPVVFLVVTPAVPSFASRALV